MQHFCAAAAPTTIRSIIVNFARHFGLALLLLACSTQTMAQGAFNLRMTIDYQGRTFSVSPSSIPDGQRTELNVDPVGSLRIYVRAISMPGVSGQALLDFQIFEPRGNTQGQVSAFTMPAYLGSQNTSDLTSAKGPLTVRAYVDVENGGGAQSPQAAVPAPPPSTPALPPVAAPIDDAPVRPTALPAPLPSPLPPPRG